jgi:hypothetical protein
VPIGGLLVSVLELPGILLLPVPLVPPGVPGTPDDVPLLPGVVP